MAAAARAAPPALSPAHVELFRELGDLKRVRSAGREGSIATRLFVAGWAALTAGVEPAGVMRRTVGSALAAARLGDLDLPKLRELGLAEADAVGVLERAFDEVAGTLHPELAAALRGALPLGPLPPGPVPRFVHLLADQPRAGVTAPGKPRLMLQPAENHAEHSVLVAIYGAIAAPAFGADPVAAFTAGMAHHFHNAAMPDSGFSGEVLLGDLLGGVIDRAREMAFAELAEPLVGVVRRALAPITADDAAEARAFHSGDVIDRVLEIEQHLKAATATMDVVLHDYELVHGGPVKGFHDRVLSDVGLL